MKAVKAIGLTLLFGVLAIVIVVVGAVVSFFLSLLVPVLTVFTGLWIGYLGWKEHAESESQDKD